VVISWWGLLIFGAALLFAVGVFLVLGGILSRGAYRSMKQRKNLP
jgi:hypothetical protein